MPALPEIVSQAWEEREGAAVLTTVDESGVPNSVYVGALKKIAEDRIVIADNYFDKTRANILAGSSGSLLFITKERKAYQLKGRFEYLQSGPIYDDMKVWNAALRPELPGVAAVVLHVTAVYHGAEQLA